MRILAGVVVVIALVLAAPRGADACSCRGPQSACEAVTEGVVFLGTPTSISGMSSEELVEFAVEDAFGGTLGKTATVVTWPMACGYKFTIGTPYVVYAHAGRGGMLSVSGCSRTAPAVERTEDLVIARAVPTKQRSLAVVTGTVSIVDSNTRALPAPVEVKVRGTAISATTSKTGEFTLHVPVGKHLLDIESTQMRIAKGKDVEISVPTPLACPRPRIVVAWNGRITGRITDRKNRPVEGVAVIAGPRAQPKLMHTSMTDDDGRYGFADLGPGRYEVAVSPRRAGGVSEFSPYPTTAYPGDVVVARGGTVNDISFRIPDPLPVHEVHGVVRTHDGDPVEGAMVNVVWSADHSQATQTNGGGGYDMRVLHGSTVRISACWYEAPSGRRCTARDVTKKITKPTDIDLRLSR